MARSADEPRELTREESDLLWRDIIKASKSVAFQWPGTVEAEDMEQMMWEHLLARPGTLWKLVDDEAGSRYKLIVSMGHQIAKKERDSYDLFTGNFKYSVNEVKRLLASGGLDNSLQSGWNSEEFIDKGGEFEDTVLLQVSMQEDLRRAMEALKEKTPQYHEVLVLKYEKRENVTENGSYRLSRALTALTDLMNRSHKQRHAERPDGPGTRKAMSNRAALAITND